MTRLVCVTLALLSLFVNTIVTAATVTTFMASQVTEDAVVTDNKNNGTTEVPITESRSTETQASVTSFDWNTTTAVPLGIATTSNEKGITDLHTTTAGLTSSDGGANTTSTESFSPSPITTNTSSTTTEGQAGNVKSTPEAV